jgi:hypothetical protein
MGVAVGLDHLVGRHQLNAGAGREAAQQGRPQEAVLDDPAHRRGGLRIGRGFAVIEVQEQRARAAVVAGVGDADVEDRLGLARDVVPQPQRREQALAGVGDRGGAAVEGGLGHRREGHPVDQRGPEARRARREGEQAAVQAGTDDRQVEPFAVHRPLMAAQRPGGNPAAWPS